ncbi:thioredoxin-disulfide reductase [Chytridiales sp. JEL 0842]|nr:thioredoxin-disulfide reductase [Chytridiales sp. JEL 0842]
MPREHHKVVVIGSGPAGHTAAIYLARANLNPVMYEGFMAAVPGFPNGVGGAELMELLKEQSIKFGTTVITETISKVDFSSRPFKLWREDHETPEETILADSVIIATGATAKRMFIKGEETFWQSGISACAVCDGAVPIFRNKPLVVVGGGDSASEEATFLTKYASKVYVLVRRDKLRASKVMAERLMKHPKVEILWNKIPVEAKGDSVMRQLDIQDTVTGKITTLDVNGLFYAIGHVPNTAIFKNQIELYENGYIVTKPHNGVPSTYTNVEGVFACGDVQDHTYRQAITAAGSGCMAALDCERWLEGQE